jgi:hypothetical protein
MDITYDLTPDDILSYWKHLYKYSRPFALQYRLGFLLAPLVGAWVALGGHLSLEAQAVRFFVVTIAVGVGYAAIFDLSLRAVVHTLAKRAEGRGVGRHTLLLEANGVQELGPAAEHAHRWPSVQPLEEGPQHFFLPVGFGFAYVVPKRAMQDAQQLQQFRDTVHRYRTAPQG